MSKWFIGGWAVAGLGALLGWAVSWWLGVPLALIGFLVQGLNQPDPPDTSTPEDDDPLEDLTPGERAELRREEEDDRLDDLADRIVERLKKQPPTS